MSVDRGGLNYPITVSYDGSAVAAFRADATSAKTFWEDLKKSLADAKTSVSGIQNTINATNQLTSAQATLNAARNSPQTAAAQAAQLAQINQQTAAVTQLTAAYQKLSAVPPPKTPGAPGGGGGGTPATPPPGATRTWGQFFQTLITGNNESNRTANNLINTFERLFMRVVIIGAIRKVGAEFRDFVGEMISFNATMEQSILGISSLLLALGHMKDATGADTNNIRGFALANAEATKQVNLLRIDALQSASTFENLAKTFQTALAPGLQAGMNLDEIRKLTVQISQAAAAIGLPQNQLSEEIRSLLAGTINARNTRIATSLGISNDDIRRAKEAGTLVEFLSEKFSAFNTAGQAALNTFTVLLSNMKDAIAQIIGTGGLGFFESVKAVLKDIQGSLYAIDKMNGALVPNPKAVYIVKQIADVFQNAISPKLRELAQGFGFEGVLVVVQSIAFVLAVIVDTTIDLVNIISGALKIFANLFNGFNEFIKALTGIDLFSALNLVEVIKGFLEAYLILTSIRVIANSLIGIVTQVWRVLSAIGLQAALLLVLTALIAEGTRQYAGYMAGAEVSWTALADIIQNNIAGAMLYVYEYTISIFENIWAYIKIGFYSLSDAIQSIFATVFAFLQKSLFNMITGVLDVIKSVYELLGKSFTMGDEITSKLAAMQTKLTAEQKAASDQRIKDINAEFDNLDRLNKESQERIDAIGTHVANSNDETIKNNKPGSLMDTAKEAMKALKDAIGALPDTGFGKFPEDLGKANAEAKTLSKTFEELPGIVSPALESFKQQSKTIHDLAEAAIKANKELTDGLSVLGLTGVVLNQRKNIFEAETKQRELQKALMIDEKSQQQTLNGIIAQRAKLEDEISSMSKDQYDMYNLADQQARKDQLMREKLAELQAEEMTQYVKLDAAKKEGNPAEISSIEKKIAATKELIEAKKDEIFLLGLSADEQLKGMSVAQAKEITDTVTKRVFLSGQQVATEERLKQIAKDKLEIEQYLNKATDDKNNLLARQSALELKNANQLAAIQALNDRATFNTRFSLPEVTSLVNARNALTLLTAQIGQAQKLRQLAIDMLGVLIAQNKARLTALIAEQALAKTDTEKKRLGSAIESVIASTNGLVQERAGLIEQNTIKIEQETLQLEKAAEAAEHARNVIEKPLSTGFLDGIRKAAQELPSLYQSTVNIIKSIVTGLTDFIAQSIVDAFDPTKKQDIVERFAHFLQAIAKQVIEMFIHLAFVKAILGLGFLGSGGIPGGGLPLGGLGFASGGPIGGSPGVGFAEGGFIRPKGLDSRDTTPIWAQPGEFMQPVHAVMKYGGDVMEKIRRGLIDPYSLRALAGMTKLDRSSVSPRLSNATNGLAVRARQQNEGTLNAPQTTQGGGGPVQAYVVANEQSLDRMLAAGRNAMFNFFTTNRGRFRGILNS